MPLDRPSIDSRKLLELVDAMAGQSVLLLADLVADRFVSGTPKRISREAPVLILQHEEELLIPGGGANAAANVAALDGRPLTVGVVGDDESGRALVRRLGELGIDTRGIVTAPGYRTPTKTRVLGGARDSIKQQIVRYDVEDRLERSAELDEAIATRLDGHAGKASVAILSDYGYDSVRPEMVPLVRGSLSTGSVVLCDSRFALPAFVGCDGATPNQEEAEVILRAEIDDWVLEERRAEMLTEQGASFLLVTRGRRGMTLLEGSGTTHIAVHGTDQVADVTGAGDTVIGTFALALAAGATRLEAALIADYAGGVVVMKTGTATLGRDELRAAIRSDPTPIESLRWVGS